MSSPLTAVISCSSAGAGSAPAWLNTRIPSRKAISVGIEVIWAAWASSLLGLGVDAAEHDVVVPLRGLLVDRRELAARPAPRRPEVDQDHVVDVTVSSKVSAVSVIALMVGQPNADCAALFHCAVGWA